jgi:serine/threonine protein kinase
VQVELKRFAAEKLMTCAKVADLFLQEISIVPSLRHPNLILYMGLTVGTVTSNVYIIYERFASTSLHDLIHTKQSFSDAEISQIIR